MAETSGTGRISIVRVLTAEKATVRVECSAGKITCLADETGAHLPYYESVLLGKPVQSQRINVDFNQASWDPANATVIGFGDRPPAEYTIPQFLTTLGFSTQEVEEALDYYDWRRVSYLFCGQISETAMRQLQLIQALRSTTPVLLLRDPFQPFNGRWREEFGERLVADAREKNRIIICSNISFLPQKWENNESVTFTDVGRLALQAIHRAAIEQERERLEKLKAQKAAEKAAIATEAANNPTPKTPGQIEPPIPLPEPVEKVYRAVYDYIFEPLADISNFFRRHHLVTGVFALALVLATMGLILVPNLMQKHIKMSEMSFDVSIKDVVDSIKLPSEKPKVVPSIEIPVEMTPDNEEAPLLEPDSEAVAEVETELDESGELITSLGNETVPDQPQLFIDAAPVVTNYSWAESYAAYSEVREDQSESPFTPYISLFIDGCFE